VKDAEEKGNTKEGLLSNLKTAAGSGVFAFIYIVMWAVGMLVIAAVIVWAWRTVFGQ
jgi:hypothetical protein